MVKALQAQKAAQSAQSLNDLGGSHAGGGTGGGGSSPTAGGLPPQLSQALGGQSGASQNGGTDGASNQAPREVGSIPEELLQRPLQDMGQEVKGLFNVNQWFGIKTLDTPEEKQRKTELHSRYQQTNQEQQQYFQARLQREAQRKQRMEQEQQVRDQQKLPGVK
jgi:hypothetical protein